MKKSLLALASGAFVLGACEFVMMGILPQTAAAMRVSIPFAGNFISSYALGVCVGTVMLIIGRKQPPNRLIILFMALALIGNALSAGATNAGMLLIARFIAGFPHGAFFGTAVLISKVLAEPGREARDVSITITGQTVANMLGVPAGTLLAEHFSWRLAFLVLAGWAAMTLVLSIVWIPVIAPVRDTGMAGQFRFLRKPGPWMILGAVFTGNAGIFCWWSYVSPWLTNVGGYSTPTVPWMMMLAGFAMVVGGLISGRITDVWKCAATAGLGQIIGCIGLVLVFVVPGNRISTGVLTFVIAFGLFFVSTPQQLLMTQAGQGGGELLGGATVQIAFNFGNAVGSFVGGRMLDASAMNYHYPALGGVPLALTAVLLLFVYSHRYEQDTDALARLQPIDA